MAEADALKGVAVETIRFVHKNIGALAALLVIPVVADTLVTTFTPQSVAYALLASLLYIPIYTWFAITIHRLVLLDRFSVLPPADARVFVFAGMVIVESIVVGIVSAGALFLVFLLGLIAPAWPWAPAVVGAVSFAVALLIGVAITARLATIFPHIAVTPADRRSIGAAFDLSEGYMLPIGARLVLFAVPYAAILGLLALIADFASREAAPDVLAEFPAWPATLVGSMINYAFIGVFVVLASHIYRRLESDLRREAVESTA